MSRQGGDHEDRYAGKKRRGGETLKPKSPIGKIQKGFVGLAPEARQKKKCVSTGLFQIHGGGPMTRADEATPEAAWNSVGNKQGRLEGPHGERKARAVQLPKVLLTTSWG